MNVKNAQYLNELVSLTVLGLMVIALIAAQGGAALSSLADRAADGQNIPVASAVEERR